MIKKFLMIGALVIIASFCMTYVTFPRCGGDAFAGSLGGSMLGSAIGTSMAQRSSSTPSSSGSDDRAIRAVDRLEDMMRRDLGTLNDKIAKLEKRIEKLESNRKKDKRTQAPERDVVPGAAKKVTSKIMTTE